MLAVPQQADAEEPVAEYVIRHHHSFLFPLYIGDMLHLQSECLAVINRLHWFTLLIHLYACEKRGMSSHCSFDGIFYPRFINTTVKHI